MDSEWFPERPCSPSHSIHAALAPQLLLLKAYRLLVSCRCPTCISKRKLRGAHDRRLALRKLPQYAAPAPPPPAPEMPWLPQESQAYKTKACCGSGRTAAASQGHITHLPVSGQAQYS